MGQLIELVFESATPATAGALLQDLVSASGGVHAVEVDGNNVPADINVARLVSSMGFCATVRLVGFDIPTVGVVPDVALRLLKTGKDCFDVEFNLDVDDVAQLISLASGLHSLARGLAQRHSVGSYFAGLEPAADEDTRLFTGESLGPFQFPRHEV